MARLQAFGSSKLEVRQIDSVGALSENEVAVQAGRGQVHRVLVSPILSFSCL